MSDIVNLRLLTEVFITLFVIMDPPGIVPIFLGLTGTMTAKERHRAARQAVLVAAGVIIAFALFGKSLLSYMHISLPALQASGGLLLLLVALDLLTGKSEDPTPSPSGVNVALVPLGTPLLEGDRLIGRIDVKAFRDESVLRVKGFWPEAGVNLTAARKTKLDAELCRWAAFAGCDRVDYQTGWQRETL